MTDNRIARGSEVNVGMSGIRQETRSARRRQVEQLVAGSMDAAQWCELNDALAAENRGLAGDAARMAAETAGPLAHKDRACAQLKSEHDKLVELVKTANARELGAKSEKVPPHQISLFDDVEAAAPPPA